MKLYEFYKIVEVKHDEALKRLNDYISLAGSLGISETDYKNDAVYNALLKSANEYRFTKNLIMSHITS